MLIGCCKKLFCEINSWDLYKYLEGGKLRVRRVKILKRKLFWWMIIIYYGLFNSKYVN